jgi:hypothetical protein
MSPSMSNVFFGVFHASIAVAILVYRDRLARVSVNINRHLLGKIARPNLADTLAVNERTWRWALGVFACVVIMFDTLYILGTVN